MYILRKPGWFLITSLIIAVFSNCSHDNTPTSPTLKNLKSDVSSIVNKHYKVGAAIGIINKQQEELHFFYGTKVLSKNDRPDENTIFQIGSITKTFTGSLLADKVISGSLNLEDHVSECIPSNHVNMPTYEDKEITLKHLVTHSSGIPKKLQDTNYPLPSGYNSGNPYANYTKDHIFDYLTNYCSLSVEPGTRYLYSNIGFGLLGHILGLTDGSSYEQSLTFRILNSLEMKNTFINGTINNNDNIALGYNPNLEERTNFDANDVFQGAGFLSSSLNDMMLYLKSNMGLIETPLKDAISLALYTHFNVGIVTYDDRPNEIYELEIGLGWHKYKTPNGYTYYWHGGSTSGYTAYIGFDKKNLIGTVILCNSADVDILIFGEEILNAIHKY